MTRSLAFFLLLTIPCVLGAAPRTAHAWEKEIASDVGKAEAYSVAVIDGGDALVGSHVAIGDKFFKELVVTRLARGSGAEVWHKELHGTATTAFFGTANIPYAILADGDGDLAVVGSLDDGTFSESHLKIYVGRLSGASGSEVWQRKIPEGYGLAGALDAAGNVLVAGVKRVSGAASAFFVAKVAHGNGADIWSTAIVGGADSTYNTANAVAVAANGDVAAGGELTNPTRDFFVVKLAGVSGNELWRKQIDGAGVTDSAASVAFDADGNVFAAGSLGQPSGNDRDFFLVKLAAATGNELWRKQFHGTTGTAEANSVAVDSEGAVLAGGYLYNEGGEVRNVVLKLANDDGSEIWRREQVVPHNNASYREGWIELDDQDDLFVKIHAGVDGGVVKLSGLDGTVEWRRGFGDPKHTGLDIGFAVADDGTVINVRTLYHTKKIPYESVLVTAIRPVALGKKLSVQDSAVAPEKKRKLQVQVKDATFAIGTPGGAADPTIGGATLTLANPVTHESTTLALPAANWVQAGKPPGSKGYKYVDKKPFEGPCTAAAAVRGAWQVSCAGEAIGFTLDEPTQGTLTTLLQLGSQKSCARFGGTVKKDLGTVGTKAGIFSAKNAPEPEVCP